MTLVLLVDDDKNLVDALETVVSGEGYRVRTAGDGEGAVLAIRRERPDVIITDLSMPRMDGAKLIGFLKTIPVLASIPVIVTSACARPLGISLHTFFAKPYSVVKLLAVLHALQPP